MSTPNRRGFIAALFASFIGRFRLHRLHQMNIGDRLRLRKLPVRECKVMFQPKYYSIPVRLDARELELFNSQEERS